MHNSPQWSLKFALAALALLNAGCAGPPAYRYVNHVLIPPAVKQAGLTQRTVTLPIVAKCSVSEDGIQFAAGRSVQVTVEPEKLVAHPAGWLQQWAEKLEDQGCVGDGEGLALATRITEIVPLDPIAASNLLRSPGLMYRDLGPEYRLFSAGPILREGAKPGAELIVSSDPEAKGGALTVDVKPTPDLIGVETAWYAIRQRTGSDGISIAFLSATDRVGDQVSEPDKPRVDYLRFSDRAAYYRFFFLPQPIRDRTTWRLCLPPQPGANCGSKPSGWNPTRAFVHRLRRGARTVRMAPFGSALSLALVATVNGKEVALRDTWTVRGALLAGRCAPGKLFFRTLRCGDSTTGSWCRFDLIDRGLTSWIWRSRAGRKSAGSL